MRAFATLSMVLTHMSNDQHHICIIALLMHHPTCTVLWAARDQSLLSAWQHRSYTQQVWNICAMYCKGSSFSRWPQVDYTSGLVTAYLISKQRRWQKNSISEVETNYRISECVSNFFHKFSRCYKIWRSLTSAHSENSHYSNSLSPLPKHLKQTRFILEWEFGKQSALHSQVKLQKDHLPTFFFFLLNCTLRQNFKRKRIIVHWLQKNYTLSCIIYIYLDWIAR